MTYNFCNFRETSGISMANAKRILLYATQAVLFFYFLFLGLHNLKTLLAPLAVAVVLSLLVLPLNRKMERSFCNRPVASILNTFLIFLISLGFLALLSLQVRNLVNDWPQIKRTMEPKVEKLKEFVFEHTPLQEEDLDRATPRGPASYFIRSGSNPGQRALGFFSTMLGFLANYLLTFVYIFFLLNHRSHFKEFLLRLFPDEKKGKVQNAISGSATVTQQYLLGRRILTGFLAAFYTIGLGITGVNNFILVSVLVAIISIIPYVGNVIGFGIAMAIGYLTSGDPMVLLGIVLTFTIGEFIESYILTPYIIGDKVDLHPFMVVLVVVVGNAVWGIVGMLLAIPLLAIVNVVLLHIDPLKPFGFLLSTEGKKK